MRTRAARWTCMRDGWKWGDGRMRIWIWAAVVSDLRTARQDRTGRRTTKVSVVTSFVLRPDPAASRARAGQARAPASPAHPHALPQASLSFAFVLAVVRVALKIRFFIAHGSAEGRAQVLPRVVRALEHGAFAQDELQREPRLVARGGQGLVVRTCVCAGVGVSTSV